MPRQINDAVSSAVITGRRMQVSQMFTSSLRLALSHSHARAVVEEKHGVAQQTLRFAPAASIPPAAGIANVAESSLRALHQSAIDAVDGSSPARECH